MTKKTRKKNKKSPKILKKRATLFITFLVLILLVFFSIWLRHPEGGDHEESVVTSSINQEVHSNPFENPSENRTTSESNQNDGFQPTDSNDQVLLDLFTLVDISVKTGRVLIYYELFDSFARHKLIGKLGPLTSCPNCVAVYSPTLGTTPHLVFSVIKHPLTSISSFIRNERNQDLKSNIQKIERYISEWIMLHSATNVDSLKGPFHVEWIDLYSLNYELSSQLAELPTFPPQTFLKREDMTLDTSLSLSWETLVENVSEKKLEQVKDLLKRSFYDTDPPVNVYVEDFACIDQKRYIISFLMNIPFSDKRIHRYNYIDLNMVDGRLNRDEFVDYHNSILIMIWRYSKEIVDQVNERIGKFRNVISIFHKDEICEYNSRSIPMGTVNFRGYYDKAFFTNRRFEWFPLGVRHVFPRINPFEIKPSFKRNYTCNFMGSLSTSPSRLTMMKILKESSLKCFLYGVDEWSNHFEGYLSPIEYKEKLLESVFTLCPKGRNIESHRIYEACETGSIPVVEDVESECQDSLYPFKQSKAPFIYVNHWSELNVVLSPYLKNKEELLRKQNDLLEWYNQFKMEHANNLESKIGILVKKNKQL